MKKTYRFKEYSLVIYPNKDNHLKWITSIIRRFNHQLLLNEDNEFFVNYWVIGAYVSSCFLRTGSITHSELIGFWEKQSDKNEKLSEIFWSFINSQ